MKTQIIGSIIVILVIFGLYVASNESQTTQPNQPTQSVPAQSDSAFKSLSIN